MLSIREFQFFDPDGEISVTVGHLPHWQQPGATYFITYRTIDSIGSVAMDRIIAERNDWLARNEIDASRPDWPTKLKRLSPRHRQAFQRMFAIEFENELDRLVGECPFQHEPLYRIVADSLHHFDGQRYRLGGFVVMPNHIHLFGSYFPGTDDAEAMLRLEAFSGSQNQSETRPIRPHFSDREL